MADERVHRGGCACGAVRLEMRGEPENVRCCHCRNCQKTMGSPFFARALFKAEQFSVTGETARWATSAALERVFCPACGTRVYADRSGLTFVGVALAAFDDPAAFSPGSHIFVSRKAPWLKLDDGLPQWAEWSDD